MRAIVLNSKVVKALTFFVLIIPSPVLSDANLVNVSIGNTSPRNVVEELDPDDTGDCLSLGELDIVFRTDNNGPPNVGVVLTDPRGRRIGFDPLIKHALSNTPGRYYLSRKVISIAMIWAVRIAAKELSRYADRSVGPIGSK